MITKTEPGVKTGLKPYVGYDANVGMHEGACLIFGFSAREARKVGYQQVRDWFDTEWIDMRAVRLWEAAHLFKEGDEEKLSRNITHVIESPETCRVCGYWGKSLNESGCCTDCIDHDADR